MDLNYINFNEILEKDKKKLFSKDNVELIDCLYDLMDIEKTYSYNGQVFYSYDLLVMLISNKLNKKVEEYLGNSSEVVDIKLEKTDSYYRDEDSVWACYTSLICNLPRNISESDFKVLDHIAFDLFRAVWCLENTYYQDAYINRESFQLVINYSTEADFYYKLSFWDGLDELKEIISKYL